MARIIGSFLVGFVLPLRGGLFLFRHRRLLALATAPLVLNVLLYAAALTLVVRYYEVWFALFLPQPQAWYLLVGYEVLRLLTFLLILAAFLFSFVFVGTAVAAPFLEVLSARVEHLLQDQHGIQPVRSQPWLVELVRALGHALLLLFIWIVTFPLSFLPGIGPALWLLESWLLLAYNFAAFALERRGWSFREQWRRLLRDWAVTLGFGAAVFVLMMVPLAGLFLLPTAAVAGTMLVLDIEVRSSGSAPRLVHSVNSSLRGGYADD
ncbi:MAG TPA: EI24 domain-containing protein [Candidatus Binatia bacterium]|jgi:CysZ protein|nr:EI24 domain-containing protein [Candidatus Binatia bacterium]